MFIRKVSKRNGHSNQYFKYLNLVESVRTDNGPRQRLILNLGNIDIHPSQYNSLAKRIEDILTGQSSFIKLDNNLEKIAKDVANKIFKKRSKESEIKDIKDYRMTDINSIKPETVKSIGAEHIVHSLWKELKMDNFFKDNGVPDTIIPIIEAVLAGRLIEPASELHTVEWAENRSALYELINQRPYHALSSYYRAADRIYNLKDEIEKYLSINEREMFSLQEKYYFFDLTNSYFEGKCEGNPKAQYGHSKEKRSDCKIVALGLIVDEMGFAKTSRLFNGNMNEHKSLADMIEELEEKSGRKDNKKTIVMDAGISSADNIKYLVEKNYSYIVVNRGKLPFDYNYEGMRTVKSDTKKGVKIEVKRIDNENEAYIICKSGKKELKEKSMRDRVEKLFLERINRIIGGIKKTNRVKKYANILEMIGRIKEKYPKASKLYEIEVIPEENKKKQSKNLLVKEIKINKREIKYSEEIKTEGSYVLRTNRTDMNDEEIWEVYIMLRNIEYSFLCMKSHLGLRPNFHRREDRMDSHMFISVMAYHFMHIIEHRLSMHGDTRKWSTIRDILKTHQRLSLSMNVKNNEGQVENIKMRLNSQAEPEHIDIYRKLMVPTISLNRRFFKSSMCSDDKNNKSNDLLE